MPGFSRSGLSKTIGAINCCLRDTTNGGPYGPRAPQGRKYLPPGGRWQPVRADGRGMRAEKFRFLSGFRPMSRSVSALKPSGYIPSSSSASLRSAPSPREKVCAFGASNNNLLLSRKKTCRGTGRSFGYRFLYSALASAFSLGSRTFSRIATIAAGTMPEPPKISLTASGAKFRMPVFAPIP